MGMWGKARPPGRGNTSATGTWCVLLSAILLLLSVFPAAADTLTPMRADAMPAPAVRAITSLGVVDAQAIALTDQGPARFDGRQWHALRWSSPDATSRVVAWFGNGGQSYALLGDATAATGVARLSVQGDVLSLEALPGLPQALAHAQAAATDNAVFVAGRTSTGTHLLHLPLDAPSPQWIDRAGWPGDAEATSLIARNTGVFVTAAQPDARERLWQAPNEGDWKDRGEVPGTVVPASARAMGQAHLMFLLHGANESITRPATFQTITSAWTTLPGASVRSPSAVAAWRDGLLWASSADGKIELSSAQVQSSKLLLRWLDWIVIVVYLAAMIGIGLYFYLREKRNSTSSFFVGGRSIPFWAAGVSLYAANTSSISFIAIPAKAFESNWQYLTNNLIAVFGLMFVAVWIVPLLRRLDLMSVFSYLETRFHPAIRMLASALCILTQIGSRMSVILFLPALAIATITGISVTWSVILMGGFTIIYTAMGGMKAVIWTDFVQVIVKMGGAIFAIGFIVWHLHGGMGEFMHTAMAENKMKLFDFSFDLTKATVWGFVFLVLFDVVLTFPKDQVLMQRTLSTKSDKEAGRSIWAFAAIMIPGGFVFYLIGTALFVFYKAHPERMNPLLPIDATFPLFIAAELPMGVTGLIVAGIFAAAMATLSGIMNSVATLISVDFYDKLVGEGSQKKSVFFAEMMTVVVGLIGIASALLLSRFDVHSLFDVSIELAGLLGGGFAGAYTLGMFTRRANAPGVAIGIGASIFLTLIAWSFKLVHPYFYLAISILLCIVIGYLASLCFPAPTRSLKGLTIYRDVE